MATNIIHPKGSMCASCERKDKDCSMLGFGAIRVMSEYAPTNDPTAFKVIRCDFFKKQ